MQQLRQQLNALWNHVPSTCGAQRVTKRFAPCWAAKAITFSNDTWRLLTEALQQSEQDGTPTSAVHKCARELYEAECNKFIGVIAILRAASIKEGDATALEGICMGQARGNSRVARTT